MKCQNCKQKLTNVAYYHGKKVCPDCFRKLRSKDKYCSHNEWLEILQRKIDEMREKLKK